jgi:hypothetical protein
LRLAVVPYPWQKVERRLADLEASFAVADQAFTTRQSPDDGAWGACYEATFLKAAATLEGLELLAGKGVPPQFAVTLEPTLQTSRQLVERMSNLTNHATFAYADAPLFICQYATRRKLGDTTEELSREKM